MLKNEWTLREVEEADEQNEHSPLEVEYNFYQAVREGDINFVRKHCEENTFEAHEGMGILSQNALTNLKYHFVVTTALMTRYCVEGGLELEQAYRLSDFYILKMDSINDATAIRELHDTMILDFTGKMHLLKNTNVISKSIKQCTDYIYNHIQERITIEALAEYTQLSPSYLSRLFKKELGIAVSDYIRQKKIEKAQNLLRYSEFSLIEIANYLSFSSQSHFIQAFEKAVGLTPKKYRDKYYRTSW